MPNIKEIALKVGFSTVPAGWLSEEKPIACATSNLERLVAFAEALVAELAKGNKPVAWCVGYDDPRMGRIHSNPTMYKPEAEVLAKSTTSDLIVCSLYTLPPTASQIEQETAEKCAEWVRSGLHDDDPYIIARGLEDGAWKEFKK